MLQAISYTTGGTVQAGNGIYLPREADRELLQACRDGIFAFVLSEEVKIWSVEYSSRCSMSIKLMPIMLQDLLGEAQRLTLRPGLPGSLVIGMG